jgi:hypothetical protein
MAEADPLLGLDAAADRLGLSRLFVRRQALAAALPTTVGVDGVPMLPLLSCSPGTQQCGIGSRLRWQNLAQR